MTARLITLENHPASVAVFNAASLTEACQKADTALRENQQIKGACWIRNQPITAATPHQATWDFLRTHTALVPADETRNFHGMQLHTRSMTVDGKIAITFDPLNTLKSTASHEVALATFDASDQIELGEVFSTTNRYVRYQMKQRLEPHYDSYQLKYAEPKMDMAFLGRTMRILIDRFGPGTVVYDQPGKMLACQQEGYVLEPDRLKNAWQVAANDYLFICDRTWGDDKATAHSSPNFIAPSLDECRIIEVINCHRGLPLQAFK